jgi:hypothetical protein
LPVAKINPTKTLISWETGILPVAEISAAATTFRTYALSGNSVILSVAKDLLEGSDVHHTVKY